MWKFAHIKVFKRWVSFVGPKTLPTVPAQPSLRLGQPPCLCCIPPTIKREGDAIKLILNSLTFSTFILPRELSLCRHPWLSAWWSLPNQVIAFIVSKRVVAQHLFQIVHCISVDETQQQQQQHQRLQNPNWVWGKKRGEECNGWPMINSPNYASARICSRSNMLTIIIFSTSATFVELNGKLCWIPL